MRTVRNVLSSERFGRASTDAQRYGRMSYLPRENVGSIVGRPSTNPLSQREIGHANDQLYLFVLNKHLYQQNKDGLQTKFGETNGW